MALRITLTRQAVDDSTVPLPDQQAWPITIVATGTNMSSEIFVWQLGGGPLDPCQEDVFSCIASPNQLEELPRHREQAAKDHYPFYRSSTLALVCRSAEEAEYIWTQVQAEVNYLVRDLNNAANLVTIASATLTGD